MSRLKNDHIYEIDEKLLPESTDGSYPGSAWAEAHRCVICGLLIGEIYKDKDNPKECWDVLKRKYVEMHKENSPHPDSDGTFVPLDDLRKRMRVRINTFRVLVEQAVQKGEARLAKGPAKAGYKRYSINGENWLFIAMGVKAKAGEE